MTDLIGMAASARQIERSTRLSILDPTGDTRSPLNRASTRSSPSPRRLIVCSPTESSSIFVPSRRTVTAGKLFEQIAQVAFPETNISSAKMTLTGPTAEQLSTVAMRDPVTITFSCQSCQKSGRNEFVFKAWGARSWGLSPKLPVGLPGRVPKTLERQ